MAAQYKTRCPHCAAQFKIGVEQLKQAKGKVRCGSCLEVFLATQNLVDEQGNPVKVKQKSASGGAAGGQSGQQQSNRQADPKQGQAKRGPAGQSESGKAQGGGAAQQPRQSQTRQQAQPQEQQPDPAQHWTLPEDDSTGENEPEQPKKEDKDSFPTNNTTVSLGDSELSESLMSMDEDGDGLGDDDFTEAGGGGDTDESWAEQLLEELDDDDSPSAASKARAEPSSPESMSLLDEWPGGDEAMKEAPEESRRGQRAPENPEDEDAEPDLFSLDLDDGAELDYVDIPTGEEDPEPRRHSQPRFAASGGTQWLKWSSLSVLALMVLAGQSLAFNFGELARTPEWRPLYAQICDLAGCALPGRSNIDRLRGANLVVRSHPEVDNALVVDAIIFNEAKYPQPFPDLELTFSSMEEQPVASRRFTPDEYRAGELENRELMPPGVPVHVSFEILDPGPDAVNYSLRFHSPAGTPDETGTS